MFYFLFHVQQSTFIQIQSCHLLIAVQWWTAEFHLTGAYFGGRAYMTSILKNHTRAYFQVRSYFRGNRVLASQNSTDRQCMEVVGNGKSLVQRAD